LDFKILELTVVPKEEFILKNPEGNHWRNGFLFLKIYDIAESISETYCLKTHMYGGHFTLSLKNAVGLVPKKFKGELYSSKYQREMISEINSVFTPDLIIIDGVHCFTDRGPMEGTLKESNIFIAGTDRTAIDAVGVAILRILGTTPEVSKGPIFRQDQIKRAVELGIGILSSSEIEFVTGSGASENLVSSIKEKLIE
jgi:uncharacterized protein (DUF362 family)